MEKTETSLSLIEKGTIIAEDEELEVHCFVFFLAIPENRIESLLKKYGLEIADITPYPI